MVIKWSPGAKGSCEDCEPIAIDFKKNPFNPAQDWEWEGFSFVKINPWNINPGTSASNNGVIYLEGAGRLWNPYLQSLANEAYTVTWNIRKPIDPIFQYEGGKTDCEMFFKAADDQIIFRINSGNTDTLEGDASLNLRDNRIIGTGSNYYNKRRTTGSAFYNPDVDDFYFGQQGSNCLIDMNPFQTRAEVNRNLYKQWTAPDYPGHPQRIPDTNDGKTTPFVGEPTPPCYHDWYFETTSENNAIMIENIVYTPTTAVIYSDGTRPTTACQPFTFCIGCNIWPTENALKQKQVKDQFFIEGADNPTGIPNKCWTPNASPDGGYWASAGSCDDEPFWNGNYGTLAHVGEFHFDVVPAVLGGYYDKPYDNMGIPVRSDVDIRVLSTLNCGYIKAERWILTKGFHAANLANGDITPTPCAYGDGGWWALEYRGHGNSCEEGGGPYGTGGGGWGLRVHGGCKIRLAVPGISPDGTPPAGLQEGDCENQYLQYYQVMTLETEDWLSCGIGCQLITQPDFSDGPGCSRVELWRPLDECDQGFEMYAEIKRETWVNEITTELCPHNLITGVHWVADTHNE